MTTRSFLRRNLKPKRRLLSGKSYTKNRNCFRSLQLPSLPSKGSTNYSLETGGRQAISGGPRLDLKGRPAGLSDPEKTVITAACQRFIDEVLESRFLPTIPSHSFQLPTRYPRQMAWRPLSGCPALSIRSAGDPRRRILRAVHSLGLDEP
jgi:hypothetical protein